MSETTYPEGNGNGGYCLVEPRVETLTDPADGASREWIWLGSTTGGKLRLGSFAKRQRRISLFWQLPCRDAESAMLSGELHLLVQLNRSLDAIIRGRRIEDEYAMLETGAWYDPPGTFFLCYLAWDRYLITSRHRDGEELWASATTAEPLLPRRGRPPKVRAGPAAEAKAPAPGMIRRKLLRRPTGGRAA